MLRRMLTAALLLCLATSSTQPKAPAPSTPLVPFPHPLITEVLYAVPTGAAGDASGDGTRDAVGDEFVELINPHDKPIQLRGYTITDRRQISTRDQKPFTTVRFTFPALELQPGEVVVVFNGHQQKWSGPVGDSARAAPGNPRFAGARIFTMNNTSSRSGFANTGDCVILWAPTGQAIHAIRWGDVPPPDGTMIVEEAPTVTGQSVTRMIPDGVLAAHPVMPGNRRFSPGLFPHHAPR